MDQPTPFSNSLQVAFLGISLVVWIVTIANWRRGIPWMRQSGSSCDEVQPEIDLLGFVVGFLGLPILVSQFFGGYEQVVQVQAMSLARLLFIALWWRVRRNSSRFRPEAEGVVLPPMTLGRAMLSGVWGFLISFLPVWILLLVVSPYREPHSLIELLLKNSTIETWFSVVMAAVAAAPLFEEFLFRVLLQSYLKRWLAPLPAILITAAGFSFSHGEIDAIPLFPLALVLGLLYERTRSFLAVVTTHTLFNGFNLLLLLLSQSKV